MWSVQRWEELVVVTGATHKSLAALVAVLLVGLLSMFVTPSSRATQASEAPLPTPSVDPVPSVTPSPEPWPATTPTPSPDDVAQPLPAPSPTPSASPSVAPSATPSPQLTDESATAGPVEVARKRLRPLVLNLRPLASKLQVMDSNGLGTARLVRTSRIAGDFADASSDQVGLDERALIALANIEGAAMFMGQRFCDPKPKPGALALRDILVEAIPGSTDMGISRPCDMGDRSEHKEGRAFDWGVIGVNPGLVDAVLAQFLATDQQGNEHALARRMGIMYIIWNEMIWTSQYAERGWRPYTGDSPHMDHVHISLSWPGALGHTSFWQVGEWSEGIDPMPSVREVLAGLRLQAKLGDDEPAPTPTPTPSESASPSTAPKPAPPKAPAQTTPASPSSKPTSSVPTSPPPPPPATPTPPPGSTPTPITPTPTPSPSATPTDAATGPESPTPTGG